MVWGELSRKRWLNVFVILLSLSSCSTVWVNNSVLFSSGLLALWTSFNGLCCVPASEWLLWCEAFMHCIMSQTLFSILIFVHFNCCACWHLNIPGTVDKSASYQPVNLFFKFQFYIFFLHFLTGHELKMKKKATKKLP